MNFQLSCKVRYVSYESVVELYVDYGNESFRRGGSVCVASVRRPSVHPSSRSVGRSKWPARPGPGLVVCTAFQNNKNPGRRCVARRAARRVKQWDAMPHLSLDNHSYSRLAPFSLKPFSHEVELFSALSDILSSRRNFVLTLWKYRNNLRRKTYALLFWFKWIWEGALLKVYAILRLWFSCFF